jgi:hypothetical protein
LPAEDTGGWGHGQRWTSQRGVDIGLKVLQAGGQLLARQPEQNGRPFRLLIIVALLRTGKRPNDQGIDRQGAIHQCGVHP